MKKVLLFIICLVPIWIGCKKSKLNQGNFNVPILSLENDFIDKSNVSLQSFLDVAINSYSLLLFDDSLLWEVTHDNKYSVGSCYSLRTGKKLADITTIGKARNEVYNWQSVRISEDNIQFYMNSNIVKSFSKEDIIRNLPMEERRFTVDVISDSILLYSALKLPNQVIVGITEPLTHGENLNESNQLAINQNEIVTIQSDKARSFSIINFDSYHLRKPRNKEIPQNILLKCAYANIPVFKNDCKTAVSTVTDQFIIYTLDIVQGKIINEKRYTELQRDDESGDSFISFQTTNDLNLQIKSIKTNEQYIYCLVNGYISPQDKENQMKKDVVFVFDWNLNPIKRFDLTHRENGYYRLSENGKTIYFIETNEECCRFYKADLII